jgi:peptidoglycan/xylan/chitin deacetylase (PgdA/CDA1 family)
LTLQASGGPPTAPPSRRELAARVSSRLGILRTLQRLRANHGLLVLAHHRIGNPRDSPFSADLFTATPEGLAEQVRLLSRWARIVSLDEVEALQVSRKRPREALVLLTFDDVYRDNYDHAFPILQAAGAPAVFFVPTGLIGTGYVPWWDRIAYAVKNANRESCRLRHPVELDWTGMMSAPEEATQQCLRLYKSSPALNKDELVRSLERATGAAASRSPHASDLFVSWNHLREMSDAGMTLASHTHSHRLLGHLSYQEQYEELVLSRELLARHTGVETRAVAYPVGQKGHFNADTRRALGEAGYSLGFSHYGGWNRAITDPFDIRRVRMEFHVDSELLHATVAYPPLFAA